MVTQIELDFILTKGRQTMLCRSFEQQGFAWPVALERLLVDKTEEDTVASVVALIDPALEEKKGIVIGNNFDWVRDSEEEHSVVARFADDVHSHLVYAGYQIGALARADNKTIVDIAGNEIGTFPTAVHPQILQMDDGSFVSLALNDLTVLSTVKGRFYPDFVKPAFPTLISEGGGFFSAIRRRDNSSSVYLNGASEEEKGRFPIIKEDYPYIGQDEAGNGNGRIVKVGGRYAGIGGIERRTIVHTLTDDAVAAGKNHIPYGQFPFEVEPQTLVTSHHAFVALDGTAQTRVYGLFLESLNLLFGEEDLNARIEDVAKEGIYTGDRVVVVPYKVLERLVKDEYL